MSDDLRKALFPEAGEPIDPVKMARRDLQKVLPRRFYKEVSIAGVEGGHTLLLDGKPVRTPAKDRLVLPGAELAELVASEWRAQAEVINPGDMPLTRLANSAIDGVARRLAETSAEVAKFAETDLVCYRAGEPDALVAAQAAAWDPVLDFAREELGARFVCGQGVVYVEQPQAARVAVAQAVEAIAQGPSGALKLAALSVETTLMGSVLLALAVARGHFTPEAAWSAAHVDEDFQARFWGADSEAIARRARRWREMEAASTLYRLAG
jgi:chaperone required for assembly of F1-ATPase